MHEFVCTGSIGSGVDYVTIKYSTPSTLHLTALIEGFYDKVTNKMIRDTAKVYLRNSTGPFAIIDSTKSVLDSTGTGTFIFLLLLVTQDFTLL